MNIKISCARKMASVIFLAGFSFSSPSMAAGIPVIDTTSIAQQVLQVEHMLTQIKSLQDQLDNMSGSRGLAAVIDSVYDTTVDVEPNEVLSDAGIRDSGEHGLSGDIAEVYDLSNENSATWLGQSQKSLEQAQQRFHALSGLIAKVNNSPDQKDILDLQARIGAEQVMLQNEMAKLTMLRSQADANQSMHNQRIQQMRIASSGEPFELNW